MNRFIGREKLPHLNGKLFASTMKVLGRPILQVIC